MVTYWILYHRDDIKQVIIYILGTTQKALKAKVDQLYTEKREHEFDIENLRNTSRKLMDDDRVCDQFVMKEGLTEIEGKWHELTELLVQQVSLEVNGKCVFSVVLLIPRKYLIFKLIFYSQAA